MVGCDELQAAPDRLVYLFEVWLVARGDDDGADARAQSGHGFFLQAAYGQDTPAQGNLACHSQVAPHRDARQGRDYADTDGNACARAVLRHGALREVDVYIVVLIEFGVYA